MSSFLNTYKDFVSGFVLFLCFYFATDRDNLDIISRVFVYTSLILVGSEVCLYFFPQLVVPVLSSIYNQGYLQFFLFQLNRNRFFGDSLNEAFIPLSYLIFLHKKNKGGLPFLLIASIVVVFFTVFVSSWRTKLIIFVFSVLLSTIIFIKKRKKTLFLAICVGIVVFGNGFTLISQNSGGTNILDRFDNQIDEYGSNSNVTRMHYWWNAIDIGNSAPLFGVGLGNYFDALPQSEKSKNMSSSTSFNEKFIAIDDPHNLFFSAYANTGLLGLFSLVLLSGYFFISDIYHLSKQNQIIKGYIIVFWSIYIYALLNPWMFFQFLGQFWIVRAIIEKNKYLKTTS